MVSAGTLAGDTTSLQGNITNDASVVFNQAANGTYAGTMSGSGSLTKNSAGTLTLSGVNSYGGGTTVNAGALAGDTASLQGDIDFGGILIFDQNSDGTYSGFLSGSGSLLKLGSGIVTIGGSNSFAGGTLLSEGSLLAGNLHSFGSGAVTVQTNTVLDLNNFSVANLLINNGGTILNAGTIDNPGFNSGSTTVDGNNSTIGTVSGTATVNLTGNGATVTNFTGGTLNVSGSNNVVENYSGGNISVSNSRSVVVYSGGNTTNGVVSGAGGLTKASTNSFTLSGVNTYGGDTVVAGGLLKLDGSVSNSLVIVQNNATLGGSGTAGGLVVETGGTVSPGNSPGTLGVAGDVVWNAEGNYNWQIFDAAGAAGSTSGWDLIAATGQLDLSLLDSTNRFNINLWSLSGVAPDADGPAVNFDPTSSYTWNILTAAGGINGFSADKFNLNAFPTNGTGGFVNGLAGGSFGMTTFGGNTLQLTFTPAVPVPEPGTWAAAALLAGAAAFARWRRRR